MYIELEVGLCKLNYKLKDCDLVPKNPCLRVLLSRHLKIIPSKGEKNSSTNLLDRVQGKLIIIFPVITEAFSHSMKNSVTNEQKGWRCLR